MDFKVIYLVVMFVAVTIIEIFNSKLDLLPNEQLANFQSKKLLSSERFTLYEERDVLSFINLPWYMSRCRF